MLRRRVGTLTGGVGGIARQRYADKARAALTHRARLTTVFARRRDTAAAAARATSRTQTVWVGAVTLIAGGDRDTGAVAARRALRAQAEHVLRAARVASINRCTGAVHADVCSGAAATSIGRAACVGRHWANTSAVGAHFPRRASASGIGGGTSGCHRAAHAVDASLRGRTKSVATSRAARDVVVCVTVAEHADLAARALTGDVRSAAGKRRVDGDTAPVHACLIVGTQAVDARGARRWRSPLRITNAGSTGAATRACAGRICRVASWRRRDADRRLAGPVRGLAGLPNRASDSRAFLPRPTAGGLFAAITAANE